MSESEENVETFKLGVTPIKNWSLLGAEDHFGAYPDYDCDALRDKYWEKRDTCWHCPVACKASFRIKEGPYAREQPFRRPEYETWGAFGPLCLNQDPELVIVANNTCNRYGVDTISTASTIAFAMECYERGLLTKDQTDGIELTWGNGPAILSILDKIVQREGFGNCGGFLNLLKNYP